MFFLINQERVLVEVMELAKRNISGILKVKENEVQVWLDWDDGKIKPKFKVTASGVEHEIESVKKVMAEVWLDKAKPELIQRLEGLREQRYGFEKEKEGTTQESTDAEKGKTGGTE